MGEQSTILAVAVACLRRRRVFVRINTPGCSFDSTSQKPSTITQGEKNEKIIYLLIAMLILLGMLPQPAVAIDDIAMYVTNFELVTKGSPSRVITYVTATILDSAELPVRSAKVTIQQTNDCPGSLTADTYSSRTNLQGVVKFNVQLPSDCTIYFMIEDVVKINLIYAPSMNTVPDRFTVYT